jgi:hypothetical protein
VAVATPPTAPPVSPPTQPGPVSSAPARKSHTRRNLAFWVAVVVVIVVAFYARNQSTPTATSAGASATAAPQVGAISSAGNAPTSTAAPTATATRATVAPPAPSCSAPCGNANGYTLTINTANRNAPTDEFSKPEPGNHLVIVTMTFLNGSNDTQRPDTFCCKLMDSLGVTRTEAFSIATGCESWQGVELARGASLGPRNMCFEAGGDPSAPLTLIWSPSFGAPDVNIRF